EGGEVANATVLKLATGKIRRPTHASTIKERLSAAVDAAMADVHEILREQNEGISSLRPVGVPESPPHLGRGIIEKTDFRTSKTDPRPDETRAKDLANIQGDEKYEGFGVQEGENLQVNQNHSTGTLNYEKSSRSPKSSTPISLTEHHPNEGVSQPPTDSELLEAQTYMDADRAGGWTTPRSRKKRFQTKCGATRSGDHMYHAHSLKAKKVKALLRLPGVVTRLRNLRERRSVYVMPATTTTNHLRIEVPWPS
ncbi:hypothetical protein GN958_ATG02540, partial [Phytophthora infestans]